MVLERVGKNIVDELWRWSLWEAIRISGFIQGTQERSLASSTLRGHNEGERDVLLCFVSEYLAGGGSHGARQTQIISLM
jgi:hypothetical protein